MFSDRRLMHRTDRGDVQQHHHARSQLLNGIDDTEIAEDTTLDARRRNPIRAAATRQHDTGLVVYDHRTGFAPMTELCRVASCITRLHDRREGDPRNRTDEGRDGHPLALREQEFAGSASSKRSARRRAVARQRAGPFRERGRPCVQDQRPHAGTPRPRRIRRIYTPECVAPPGHVLREPPSWLGSIQAGW